MLHKLFKLFSYDAPGRMKWSHLTNTDEVESLLEHSRQAPQLIYKHSNACVSCWFTKRRIESIGEELMKRARPHFVDVLAHRAVSNYLAERLKVKHESPQAILVADGEAVRHTSHSGITGERLLRWVD